MVITQITSDKKNKLFIQTDAGVTFPIYKHEANSYHLEEGMDIDDKTWAAICKEILFKRATKRAMFILQKMDRTEKQLRDKLAGDKYPEEVIDHALDYVKSFHYIDDFRYASAYIRYHQSEKSRIMLKQSLLQKGVSSDIIDEALDEEYCADEQEMIAALLKKRKYNAQTADMNEKRKTYAFLARKGYSASAINKALNTKM